MVSARIDAIEYYLPSEVLSNTVLSQLYPEWTAERIEEKTGIRSRHIAGADETAADLAVAAAKKLFATGKVSPDQIDFVLFCTQSPDYILPTSACMIQHRLGIPTTAGALDFNQGCSGFVYGLALAKGLVETGAAMTVLLLTGETYSKWIGPMDKGVRTLFGDGAAATLIRGVTQPDGERPWIGPFVFGTDGSGADRLIVKGGGTRHHMRQQAVETTPVEQACLYMDGPSIFSFSLKTVPPLVAALLEKAELRQDDVAMFVFHQANQFMLEALRRSVKIPVQRFVVDLLEQGNTVSSTIPIALANAAASGRLPAQRNIMVVGFGVGLSWAASMIRIDFTCVSSAVK